MMSLSVYYGRAMDAVPDEELIEADQKCARMLSGLACKIVNPAASRPRNVAHEAYEIAARDLELLKKSDIFLVDLSRPDYRYVGCVFEMAHAHIYKVPIIAIVGNTDFSERIFIHAYADFIAGTMREAVEYIERVYTEHGQEKQMRVMHEYFDSIASRHRTIVQDNLVGNRLRGKDELHQLIQKYVSGSILEIGSGSGYWTEQLCNFSNDVVGIELSSPMLKQAIKLLGEREGLKLIHTNFFSDKHLFSKTGNARKHYDCIIVFFFLSLLPRQLQQQAMHRLSKLTKSGGLLLVADSGQVEHETFAGIGRKKLQNRKNLNEEFIIYKEHFNTRALADTISIENFNVIDESQSNSQYPWFVARRLK